MRVIRGLACSHRPCSYLLNIGHRLCTLHNTKLYHFISNSCIYGEVYWILHAISSIAALAPLLRYTNSFWAHFIGLRSAGDDEEICSRSQNVEKRVVVMYRLFEVFLCYLRTVTKLKWLNTVLRYRFLHIVADIRIIR